LYLPRPPLSQQFRQGEGHIRLLIWQLFSGNPAKEHVKKSKWRRNAPVVMAVLDTRLSGLINEQYQGVIPERRASRVLSGIHLTAHASFDMDSRQSLKRFRE
jgi:hypothetical protein